MQGDHLSSNERRERDYNADMAIRSGSCVTGFIQVYHYKLRHKTFSEMKTKHVVMTVMIALGVVIKIVTDVLCIVYGAQHLSDDAKYQKYEMITVKNLTNYLAGGSYEVASNVTRAAYGRCDPLEDEFGIAHWLLIQGAIQLSSSILKVIEYVVDPLPTVQARKAEEDSYFRWHLPVQLLLALIFLFDICWILYGSAVVFSDHPDDSECPDQVHVFAFIYLVVLYVFVGFKCCLGIAGVMFGGIGYDQSDGFTETSF